MKADETMLVVAGNADVLRSEGMKTKHARSADPACPPQSLYLLFLFNELQLACTRQCAGPGVDIELGKDILQVPLRR
jgi:hypothetical protein